MDTMGVKNEHPGHVAYPHPLLLSPVTIYFCRNIHTYYITRKWHVKQVPVPVLSHHEGKPDSPDDVQKLGILSTYKRGY